MRKERGERAMIHLRLLKAEKERYEELADAEGMSLSAFLRWVIKRGVKGHGKT